ncbi:MAG: hypothetical protein ACI3YC_09100, partial [Alloprevotella sp.]
FATLLQPFCNPFATLLQPSDTLQNPCKTPAKPLQNPCKNLVGPLSKTLLNSTAAALCSRESGVEQRRSRVELSLSDPF